MERWISFLMMFFFTSTMAVAEEGMWIPMFLEQLNQKQMQEMGMKLTAEDIYSLNKSSLKDAIVQFGGGCTAEIISSEGLILTNHHCGYGSIQRLSSLEHDYLTNGYWAQTNGDEIPCPGLTVTLLVRMEEVTDRVLKGVDEKMNQLQRGKIIRQNIETIEKEAVNATHYEAKVKSFFYGNQYFLFINEVFKDIRLVGTPPSSIGKFGGDTDNWMWPRHTGDFSIFRIYVGKENKPAPFSAENVPYVPKNFLTISLTGYEKSDFTFIFGYPGNTREYLTSFGIKLSVSEENPIRIKLREKRLDIMGAGMNSSRRIQIQYANKYNGIANGWKKYIGETRGINRLDAVKKKEHFEKQFQSWADSNEDRRMRYGGLLKAFEKCYQDYLPFDRSSVYITEAGQSIEIVKFAAGFRDLVKASRNKKTTSEELARKVETLTKSSRDFFKNYNAEIDLKLTMALLPEMAKNMDPVYLPGILHDLSKEVKDNYAEYANHLFTNSMLTDSVKLYSFLKGYKPSHAKRLERDPAYLLSVSIYNKMDRDIQPKATELLARLDSLQRIYMAGQMEMQGDRRFYPDANSTLRISYGKVDDYTPADGVNYNYFTTLDGVMQKEDSTINDYFVEPQLKALYIAKDFGRYADRDGTIHVAFTASNHTSGGNSGSPVLNAEGQLIGINFDRNWEGTMSDLMYDPAQCRNISLDIRYCLFIIDKYAGARRLIKEMRIAD